MDARAIHWVPLTARTFTREGDDGPRAQAIAVLMAEPPDADAEPITQPLEQHHN